jgi:YfiH family protein
MLEVLKDPLLQTLPPISHGFFTRQDGVSTGIYGSLNCSYASQDNPQHVRENRRRVMAYFSQPFESLVTVKNNHGNHVVIVDEPWPENKLPQADGMVTKQKNITLGTDTADCPCVLFADAKNSVIGLCHAGWRGAKNGIIEQTISQMVAIGAMPNQMVAAIGPCIKQDSYEVGADFYQQFITDIHDNQPFFKPATKANHWYFDLTAFVKQRLISAKLKDISVLPFDTYQDEDRFFSYRRSTHRKEPDFGGHFAGISLL